MLAAAIVSLVLGWQCRAPTILGHVSSFTRDSRYFEETDGASHSTENGSERTKRLGSLKVIVGEVGGSQDSVGKVAFVPAEMGTKIEKGRCYM
jgi:hypothetical protein